MDIDLYIITDYKPKESKFAISVLKEDQILMSTKFVTNNSGVNKFALVSLISSLGVTLQVIQKLHEEIEYIKIHTNNRTIEGLLTGKFSKKIRNATLIAQLNHLLSKSKVVFEDSFNTNVVDYTFNILRSNKISVVNLPKV